MHFAGGGVSVTYIINQAFKAFFPVLTTHYWFVTAYIILMFFSPFFNQFIFMINKHTYQMLLTMLIFIFCIIMGGFPLFLKGMSEGRLIPVFIMYFIAGYIKKYAKTDTNNNNSKKHLLIALLVYILLFASVICIEIIGVTLNSDKIIKSCYILRPLNSPLVLSINVSLFLAFKKMTPIKSKLINSIASNTFGIYLIHSNEIVSGIVLPKIFPIYKETNSAKLLIYSIGAISSVYIVCSFIDILRQKTVHQLWLKLLDTKYEIFIRNFKRNLLYICRIIIQAYKNYYN